MTNFQTAPLLAHHGEDTKFTKSLTLSSPDFYLLNVGMSEKKKKQLAQI